MWGGGSQVCNKKQHNMVEKYRVLCISNHNNSNIEKISHEHETQSYTKKNTYMLAFGWWLEIKIKIKI